MNKNFPVKFRALINFNKSIKPSKELATIAIYRCLNDIEYRLDGYRLSKGEEMGWFFGNNIYELHVTDDNYHDLYITILENNHWGNLEQNGYPEIRNIASIMRTKTKPVRIYKNSVKNRKNGLIPA